MKPVNSAWPVIGHNTIIEYLRLSLKSGEISHAYLFEGKKSLGKLYVAKKFIQSIACQRPCDGQYCNQCSHCHSFQNGSYVDLFEVRLGHDQKTGKLQKNIGIEQVHFIRNIASKSSFSQNYTFVLIHDAHLFSLNASNAFLKTLEEPRKKIIFILIAESSNLLPQTIASRCQVISFRPVCRNDIFEYLVQNNMGRENAENISRASCGKPGIALSFKNDVEYFQEYKKNARHIVDCMKGSLHNRMSSLNKLFLEKRDFNELIHYTSDIIDLWITMARDIVLIQQALSHFVQNHFIINDLEQLSQRFSKQGIVDLIQNLTKAKEMFIFNMSPKKILESVILKI
jgi:hypothetical protein